MASRLDSLGRALAPHLVGGDHVLSGCTLLMRLTLVVAVVLVELAVKFLHGSTSQLYWRNCPTTGGTIPTSWAGMKSLQ